MTFLSACVKTGMRRRRDCMIPPERHTCPWKFKRENVVVPLSLPIQCEFRNLFRLTNYIRRQINRGYSCSQTNPEHLVFIGFDKLTRVVASPVIKLTYLVCLLVFVISFADTSLRTRKRDLHKNIWDHLLLKLPSFFP